MLLTRDVIRNIRKEIIKNVRKDTFGDNKYEYEQKNLSSNLIEKIKKDLACTLYRRGIDISNMQINFEPDNSNVMVYIKGR